MSQQQIFDDIKDIFTSLFKNQSKPVTKDTSPEDVSEWNSLNHVVFIDTIEKHFKIKFDLADMLGFETIGDICLAVEKQSAE